MSTVCILFYLNRLSFFFLVPVSLISTPTNKTINETDTVIFFCTASGNPEPTITWLNGGQTVGNGNTLNFTAFRNHSGNYMCSADNGLNVTVTASAYLDVQCMYMYISYPV